MNTGPNPDDEPDLHGECAAEINALKARAEAAEGAISRIGSYLQTPSEDGVPVSVQEQRIKDEIAHAEKRWLATARERDEYRDIIQKCMSFLVNYSTRRGFLACARDLPGAVDAVVQRVLSAEKECGR